jgi:hypothetical protein
VAQALEEVYKNRLEEHAAELAEHFSYSSDSADLEKSISYGQMAAKRATAVYAFGEAVRLLEQALGVQEILDPEDKARRCDLLIELGQARLRDHDYQHILDNEAPLALSWLKNWEMRSVPARPVSLPYMSCSGLGSAFVRPNWTPMGSKRTTAMPPRIRSTGRGLILPSQQRRWQPMILLEWCRYVAKAHVWPASWVMRTRLSFVELRIWPGVDLSTSVFKRDGS